VSKTDSIVLPPLTPMLLVIPDSSISTSIQMSANNDYIIYDPKQADVELTHSCDYGHFYITKAMTGIDQELYTIRNSNNSLVLWKHGQAGIYDNQGEIKPTNWYGKQHEFNFEFVVNDIPTRQKIFNNLKLVSNKT
jgi:hypothetical protein